MVHKLRTITNTKHIFQIGSTSNGFNCKTLSRYIFVIKPKTSDRKTLFIPEEYRRWTTRVEDFRSNRTNCMRTGSSWSINDRRSTNWETKSISTNYIELRILWRKNWFQICLNKRFSILPRLSLWFIALRLAKIYFRGSSTHFKPDSHAQISLFTPYLCYFRSIQLNLNFDSLSSQLFLTVSVKLAF